MTGSGDALDLLEQEDYNCKGSSLRLQASKEKVSREPGPSPATLRKEIVASSGKPGGGPPGCTAGY